MSLVSSGSATFDSKRVAQEMGTAKQVRKHLGESSQTRKRFLLLAETFQALGDSSRVQIVWALTHGELSVGKISELLGMSQPAVSHHLRTLRNLKLVRFHKVGRTAYYALDDDHIERLLLEGIKHVEDLL